MRIYSGLVKELRLEAGGSLAAEIACPAGAVPAPGRYTLAVQPDSLLPVPLFSSGTTQQGFMAALPFPTSWTPGCLLELRGPLGRGFHLPANLQRLALLAAGDSVARLLPLSTQALAANASVALFSDAALPPLPSLVEAYPSSALPEAYSWADFLAVDLPIERLPELNELLRQSGGLPPCPGQALIVGPMPCGGLAECGVCALPDGRGWSYTCKDGPVFELNKVFGRKP